MVQTLRIILATDGYVLYEGSALIFLAQLSSAGVGIGDSTSLLLIAIFSGIGVIIPCGTIIILAICVDLIGLPTTHITSVLIVDWFLDRFRTCIVVFGQCCVAAAIDTFNNGEECTYCMKEVETIENQPDISFEEANPKVNEEI